MKRIFSHIILLVSAIQLTSSEAGAQAMQDSHILNHSLYREKLQLFTDRNLYASGEKISFRLYNLSHPLLKENGWSRVFYLELVNTRNTAVARGKYRLNSQGGEGQIIIPDTVGTGHYYLRAYTNWMRNYPPSGYFHLPLAIVNPRRISSGDLSAGSNGIVSSQEAPGPVAAIACTADKGSYGKREKVSVRIRLENGDSSPDAYCISVTKTGYLDEAYHYTPAPVSGDPLQLKDLVHYPETKGATLSGMVMIGEEERPADYYLLGMTMLGSDPDYMEFMTDRNGRFLVNVHARTGKQDALLTVHSKRQEAVKILTDEAFSSDFSAFPIPAADFFGEGRALVEELMVNVQLRAAFRLRDRDSVDAEESHPDELFYGFPEFRYRTEDYVALPDLEEFFFEIVPQVQVERTNGQADLAVLDDDGRILPVPPLILVDYVPVPDIGELLSVSPQRIDHIDIVNRLYLRRDHTYGGIVNITTRRGDRAGIELPGSASFIRFDGLTGQQERESPEYEGQLGKDRIPDLRNTLYWEADYEITPENGGRLEFYTSDLTGEYMVVVRGMTSAGKLLSGTCRFMVK